MAPPLDERSSGRIALIAFGAYVAVAFPTVLFWLGKDRWFAGDEWYFLAGRDAGSLDDLFRPHNQHWSTIPILIYRGLFHTVGLHSYIPYQAWVVGSHLVACVLLRIVIRRAGVDPWLATAAAGAFVLFGPGGQNITSAFQVGFSGALASGLAQLLLADHEGSWDRRDWLGLAAGGTALLMSGVGVTTAVVVGMATLVHRGWRIALLHTAPLATVFIVWMLVERPELTSPIGRPSPSLMVDWVRSGETGTFLAVGHFPAVAIVLSAILFAGLGLALVPIRPERSRALAAPAALLVGGIVFQVITAQGRAWRGVESARTSRYVYLCAAFALPAIAVAADEIARRWRVLRPVLVVLLVIAIPWNIRQISEIEPGPARDVHLKEVLTNVTRVPGATAVPRSVRPYPSVFGSPDLTLGFLLDADAAGRLPATSSDIPPGLRGELRIRLGVAQSIGRRHATCRTVVEPVDISPSKGAVYRIEGRLTVSSRTGPQKARRRVKFGSEAGQILTIELGGLELRLEPLSRASPYTLCVVP